MSRAGSERPLRLGSSAAFSLIELVAALAVLALIAVVSVPMGMRAYDGMKLRRAAVGLAGTFGDARARAIRSGSPVSVAIDVAAGRYAIEGDPPRALGTGMALTVHAAAETSRPEAGVASIGFGPDGGGTGGRVTLASGETAYDISVDWLTGKIELSRHASRTP